MPHTRPTQMNLEPKRFSGLETPTKTDLWGTRKASEVDSKQQRKRWWFCSGDLCSVGKLWGWQQLNGHELGQCSTEAVGSWWWLLLMWDRKAWQFAGNIAERCRFCTSAEGTGYWSWNVPTCSHILTLGPGRYTGIRKVGRWKMHGKAGAQELRWTRAEPVQNGRPDDISNAQVNAIRWEIWS